MDTKRYRLKIATWTVVREPGQPSPRILDTPEVVVDLDAIRHELAVYNALLPADDDLSATLMVEIAKSYPFRYRRN